jgi:hypothetical protein
VGSPVPANAKEAGALISRSSDAFDATPALVPTDRFLELSFSSRVNDADLLRIFALANQHGLVVYDPEAPGALPAGRDVSAIT